MVSRWNYGDAYKRHPIGTGGILFRDGSRLQVHDIFDPLPEFMKEADLLFIDPPWNLGNLNTFYTKAGIKERVVSFRNFYLRLFECIKTISPNVCYVEVGKQSLAEFITEMKKLYRHVTFYNSTYYHNKSRICYVVRGSKKRKTLPLDYMDEEDIIAWVCENEEYSTIGDLCMGRGLVAIHAYKNGKRFVGTELNHRRLSVAVEKVRELGAV
ncbi:MAG TPA: hypothetical protein VFD15_06420 [Clostridia bacterium]|nr:hypothetical protein [Clostridia bacterium]